MRVAALCATSLALSASLASLAAVQPRPGADAFDQARLAGIDRLVTEAIARRQLPGAVIFVGHGSRDVYRKAFGSRAVEPAAEPMTADTIFDVASLTKVVATTTSVMILVEEGRLRLADRVAVHIPEFGRYGKQDVTILQLLTHVSGLRPDLDLALEFEGDDEAIRRASEEVLVAAPGERFIYSDINFFLLGEIVRRVSGRPLDVFAQERIFEPLGMRDTGFHPPEARRARIAPTERCRPLAWPCGSPGAPMLRGIVHDPTARRMGGVAGHAGLFSTADDLARFCRMLLRGGELDGVRLLAPLTVAKMVRPATPPGLRSRRGLGWDLDTLYSANRGDLLPIGSFGHTGFTGTSLWMDPSTGLFVVFLSNRVHPDGKGDVTALRGRVATIAAAALISPSRQATPLAAFQDATMTGADFGPSGSPPPSTAARRPTLAGIDVLRAEQFERLRGKRIALLTHHAARAADGMTTLDVLRGAPGVTLVSVLAPEHGLPATLDTDVSTMRDDRRGITVYSLYGETRRPTPAMLEGIDAVVIDLVDVGARFYTYSTTMAYVMEEAAKAKVGIVVLDRPNPVNGISVEGPLLDEGLTSFTGYFRMPARHGLTLGELARLYNGEKSIGANVTVVEALHWERDRWFDETGLAWTNPSPAMRNLLQATLYPGIGGIEWTNISVGRGTEAPFEQVGAPWVDGVRLAERLNARRIPGIRFYPVRFTPESSVYARQECSGVFMVVTDRDALRPVRLGIEIASALLALHPDRFEFRNTVTLLGSHATLERLRRGDDPAAIAESWAVDEAQWRLLRSRYLLYR